MDKQTLELLRSAMSKRKVHRVKDTIFIPLPSLLWRKSDCDCAICKADNSPGYYDTLAVSKNPENYDTTWEVHYPELHDSDVRKIRAIADGGR